MSAPQEDSHRLADGELLEALRWMQWSRIVDARLVSLQRQGRMGTVSPVHGQEACVVGAALALDPARDWLVPAYREAPAMMRHGYPLENFIRYWRGDFRGGRVPNGVRMLPVQVALAAQLPQAVGLAWGRQLQGFDEVVMTFFGDGASSEGDFHEALNLSGLTKAPVVFILQNNGWAISTPRARQSAAHDFASRAMGYGIPGVRVDGNDVVAAYNAASAAVDRARKGDGPTLIEMETQRMSAHNTADDPSKYRDQASLQQWVERDPLTRVMTIARERELWDDAQQSALEAEIHAEIDAAVAAADQAPAPTRDQLFEHVYADPPRRLIAQAHAATAREVAQ